MIGVASFLSPDMARYTRKEGGRVVVMMAVSC